MPPLALEVRTKPGEEPTRLDAAPELTVAGLKAELATRHTAAGWQADAMNLIVQGKFLDDSATLSECGLRDGDFLVATGMVPQVLPPPAEEQDMLAAGEPDDDRIMYTAAMLPEVPPSDTMGRV